MQDFHVCHVDIVRGVHTLEHVCPNEADVHAPGDNVINDLIMRANLDVKQEWSETTPVCVR